MGVSETTAAFVLEKQLRCCECGKDSWLELHHRFFRSVGEEKLQWLLGPLLKQYKDTYGKELVARGLHDVQNLVVLCAECHTGKLHNGDYELVAKYQNSFTCPFTGFNVPYKRVKALF